MDKILHHRSSSLFYRVEGNASEESPLILIHGFAEDGRIWEEQLGALKDKHRLIIPDLPGSGRSSALDGETSMEELAECILAVLDAEDIGEAILVGHSMGGYVALAFAERYPGRLSAFGLFHSTAYADSEEKKALRRKSNEFIRKHGAAPFIQQSTPNLFGEAFCEQHPERVDAVVGLYAGSNPDSLIYYYNAMIRRPDRTKVLKQAKQPVLLIIGDQDKTIPLETSLQQAYMPALSSIHLLGRAGHMGMLEEGARSSMILEEFLAFVLGRMANDNHSRNENQP